MCMKDGWWTHWLIYMWVRFLGVDGFLGVELRGTIWSRLCISGSIDGDIWSVFDLQADIVQMNLLVL